MLFSLTEEPEDRTLQNGLLFLESLLKPDPGNVPCPLHNEFKSIRNQIQEMLKKTTIEDFNEDLNLGITTLKK